MNNNRNKVSFSVRHPAMLVLVAMFFVTILPACNYNGSKGSKSFSRNQQYLSDLLYDYKTAYTASPNDSTTQFIMDWYHAKLNHFLIDSVGRVIDSIRVTVDDVIEQDRVVTTRFHFQEIEFKYSMKFIENLDERESAFYQWMRNLQPGTDITTRFTFVGESVIKPADDTLGPIIRIFAYPAPVKSGGNP